MKLHNQKSAPFGEVVAAVFDKAQAYGKTPTETARLASLTVMHVWLKNHPTLRSMTFAVALGFVAIVSGCATTPLQTEKSTSGIRAAEEVGADKVPQASMHLLLAKEELDAAKAMSKKEQRPQAISMLARSEVDAELALLLSREDAQRAEATAAVDRARKLKQANP
jgi:hypothetical protein